MGCRLSQPDFVINEELNDLCEKIGKSSLDDDILEALAFTSLRSISEEVRRAYNLPVSVLKQFQFIRDFFKVSRKQAYTPSLQKQFTEVEQMIRMKTWGCGAQDEYSTPEKTKKRKNSEYADSNNVHRAPKAMVFTDELSSIRYELALHNNTHSISLSYCDIDIGSLAATPMSSSRRGASMDSHGTENTCSTISRFKSLYISPGHSVSQDTLGDFGFFDGEDEGIPFPEIHS